MIIKQWSRNEIENYLPLPKTLLSYSNFQQFGPIWNARLNEIIEGNTPPLAFKDMKNNFWISTKISDDYLSPLFEQYFDDAGIPRGVMDKSKFYQLVEYIDPTLLDKELIDMLNSFYNHFNGEEN